MGGDAPLIERADAILRDPDALRLIKKRQLKKLKRARDDVASFFEFVMREETTRERLKLAPHQRVMLDFVWEHPFAVVMMPPGHSKCHGRGTPILMADGSVRAVEDVRVGDYVMGPQGPRRVTHASRGRGPLYRVIPTKGDSFVVNDEHVLTLVGTHGVDAKGHRPGSVVDISVRDFLARSPWFRERHKLFRVGVERFAGEKPLAVDPYFLGLWFGDGLHSVRHGVRLTSADAPIRDYCEELGRSYGLEFVKKNRYEFALCLDGGKRHRKGREGAERFNPLMSAIRSLVGDGLSMECAKRAPREDRLRFLAGFVDADGCVKDNCVYVTQKRKDWLDAIVFIARSLGIAATVGTTEHPTYGTFHRACLFGGNLNQIPTMLARRALRKRAQRKDALRAGFRIEPLGRGDYFGFTIGGDGRYLLGDFTVTHNTFCSAALAMFLMGRDVTLRGAVVSSTQEQAKKPLAMVKDYVVASSELHAVFPDLRPSSRASDSWTQERITIDRPQAIRDATLSAVGIGGALDGSRLNFIIVDDILSEENTRTKEGRDSVYNWFQKTVVTRLDPRGARLVFTNTAWHPQDVAHRLRDLSGRPTLRMSVTGDVHVEGRVRPAWGASDAIAAEMRPKSDDPWEKVTRLTAHDPDPRNEETLWPERVDRSQVEELRANMLPEHFTQLYEQECRDDSTAMCKQAYVDACVATGRRLGISELVERWGGDGPTTAFTGVDLSTGEGNDETSIFTFYVRPEDKVRVILGIEEGMWDADEIVERVIDVQGRYNSILRVEDNGTQKWIRQMVLNRNKSIPINDHTTDATKKKDPVFGMRSIFVAMKNGAWAFPCSRSGAMPPEVAKFANSCLFYKPSKHTPDNLMAAHLACAQAAEWGLLAPTTGQGESFGQFAASLMAR